jgi:peptide/nickel transport system permease protein
MGTYIVRRLIGMIPTVIVITVLCFVLIQLPPGDFLTYYAGELMVSDSPSAIHAVEILRDRYAFDQPLHVQFWSWVSGFPRGDFGVSMLYRNIPVAILIWNRLGLTLLITGLALVFSYVVAIPIGIYSATHQRSLFDYIFSIFAFLGLAIPNFLLALVLTFVAIEHLGMDSIRGLFSEQYANAPWSIGKLFDMFKQLFVPVVVIGTAGTASIMRIMRGNLLDLLGEPFIQTARAKGLRERVVILRHAVRIAINPLVSRLGMLLPRLLGAEVVTSMVLSLPTTGYLLYRALLAQDMYLAGTIVLLLALILVVGNLVADLLLAGIDPRIRYS